jgi:serine/threonine protein kinase
MGTTMAAPSTADEFLELTVKSGLVEPQELRAYLQGLDDASPRPDEAKAMADALLRDGLLTRFHVEQLLRGKWRNFVLSGKYKVLGPLGSGGMGQVYLCEHQVMRRRVAVKVLPDPAGDASALERFRREARAVAQLKHPNIVGGHDIDRDGKLHFLVMEYIDGSTLYSVVKRHGPMDPVRAAHYVRQAALGLQHAHEAGLVHRDIKPSNLLLDRSGTVKILDLGLARFFHDKSDDLSRRHAESPVGTMDYMAPEQAVDSHRVDIRADIYSLGATLYFLLAGHGPFSGATPLQKLLCHQLEEPRPIRELRPQVPRGMDAVIERMMAKDPAERYQTPAEVVRALAPWTRKPIAPPPPEEMPELAVPTRASPDGSASPALPAFLYEAPTPPTPAPSPQAYQETPAGSQRPTVPLPGGPGMPPAPPQPGAAGRRAGKIAPRSTGRRRNLVLLAAAAVVLLGAGVTALAVYGLMPPKGQPVALATSPETTAAQPQPAVTGAPPPLRLLVPAYFYPADKGLAEWDRVIDSPAAAATVVIANPDSGPGKAADDNYAKVLERARRNGVSVIGYVSTKYADRPLNEVKADVDRWVRFYPGVQGIFFDEQASAQEKVFYYAALYEYVRKTRGLSLVVGNPGTECAEEYLKQPAADVACLVEAPKDFSAYHRPEWAGSYPADRFAAVLRKNGTPEQMRRAILQMRASHIGYCFITDADEPNPWGRLPQYWEAEVEAVQEANRR